MSPVERSAGGGGGGGGLTVLNTTTLAADAASLDTGANAIAAGFNAILVVAQIKTAWTSWVDNCAITLNGDTGANYDLAEWYADAGGTSNKDSSGAALTAALVVVPGSSGSTQNYLSSTEFIIPGYTSTSLWKTATGSTGTMDTGVGHQAQETFQFGWRSTAAVNQITFKSNHAATNVKAGSKVVVYGLT